MPSAAIRRRAYGALALTIFGWGIAPVFIRFMSDTYDPFTQSFVRYVFGTAALLALCLGKHRPALIRSLFHPAAIALGILNFLNQTSWTWGCYGAEATVAQLISKINLVFIILLSWMIFREERAVIRHPLYIGGTAVSFVGVTLVLMTDPASFAPRIDIYTIMLLLTSVGWAVYSVWGKHLVRDIHPLPMFTAVAVYSTIGFWATAEAFGTTEGAWSVPAVILVTAAVSGAISIAGSHACHHYAQKYLGAAFCGSIGLLNPLVTYFFALVILPDERLAPTQWIGAVILSAGALGILLAAQRVQRRIPVGHPE